MAQMKLSTKHKQTHIEIRLVVAKGERGGSSMDWKFGVSRCKPLRLEWIDDKVLQYSKGNYSQSFQIVHDGR